MDDIPKQTVEWFERMSVVYGNNQQSVAGQMVRHKTEHTKRVVRWGRKIMEMENWLEKDKQKGLVVCLLHDVGRFVQAEMGTYDDKISINHAEAGARMAEESGVFEAEIVEAIRKHNDPFYSGDNPLVRLVRDADQMAILEELPIQMTTHEKSWWENRQLDEEVAKKYRNKEVIDSAYLHSVADWLLQIASWGDHFNFEITRKLFDEQGYLGQIKAELIKFNPEIDLNEVFGD